MGRRGPANPRALIWALGCPQILPGVCCAVRWCQSVPQFQGLGDSEFLPKAMRPRSAGLFHRNFATCFGYEGA